MEHCFKPSEPLDVKLADGYQHVSQRVQDEHDFENGPKLEMMVMVNLSHLTSL